MMVLARLGMWGLASMAMTDAPRVITKQLLKILRALLAAPDHEDYGWNLMQSTELGGPTVYRMLNRLERFGMVSSRWVSIPGGTARRHMYQLTYAGFLWAQKLTQTRQ